MQGNGLRQQHGSACEECRRRKARCDRVRPRCGSCTENGIQQCIIVSKRPQRGPKKGQLDMMRSRIDPRSLESGCKAMLERELGKQSGGDMEPIADSPTSTEDTVQAAAMPGPLLTALEQNSQTDMHMMSDDCIAQMIALSQRLPPWPTTTKMAEPGAVVVSSERFGLDCGLTSPDMPMNMTLDEQLGLGNLNPMLPADVEISHLMLADLDDVYFDRAHNICPMVHQRRYFTWASESHPSPARACLRSAMRTLAAAMSAPYRSLVGLLHAETCRLLEESKQAGSPEASWPTAHNKVEIEYMQAWLLVAHYECLRANEGQAMLTAGRAFRLVQMARLHDMDEGEKAKNDVGESFAETEEKRRTFWVAYNLDCFLCWRNEWPLTLYEDMVGTRLPASETHFQNSKAVRTASLAEALATSESSAHLAQSLSPFAECVVLATLHNRCVAHRRAAVRDRDAIASGSSGARGFWGRLEWLAAAVDRRIQLLGRSARDGGGGQCEAEGAGDGEGDGGAVGWAGAWAPVMERDPMLFFTHMLAYSAVVCLGTIVQATPCHVTSAQHPHPHPLVASVYEQRASQAAADMARLVNALPSLSCFKAHPFLPNPLATAVAFLQGQPTQDAHAACNTLLRVLQDLRNVNSLALDICLAHLL